MLRSNIMYSSVIIKYLFHVEQGHDVLVVIRYQTKIALSQMSLFHVEQQDNIFESILVHLILTVTNERASDSGENHCFTWNLFIHKHVFNSPVSHETRFSTFKETSFAFSTTVRSVFHVEQTLEKRNIVYVPYFRLLIFFINLYCNY